MEVPQIPLRNPQLTIRVIELTKCLWDSVVPKPCTLQFFQSSGIFNNAVGVLSQIFSCRACRHFACAGRQHSAWLGLIQRG